MNILPIPIFTFIRITYRNGKINISKIAHLLPWLLKFVLFEPLRIIELLIYNKRITQFKIDRDPIFILGYYRSGTTYLQRLFIQDKNLGYQTVFQTSLPEIMLGFEAILKPILSGITKIFKIENKFHKVPFTWDFPGEEDVALIALGIEGAANWGNIFPKNLKMDYEKYVYFECDSKVKLKWKSNYLYWIKKLSLRNEGNRLVLKSPPNTARIPVLLEMFPNARFVCIQRNPYDVYTSSKNFWKIVSRYYALQRITDIEIENLILDTFKGIMDYYQKYKELIPRENLIEVSYEHLSTDTLSVFRGIYNYLNLGNFEMIEKDVEKYIHEHSNYKSNRNHISDVEKTKVNLILKDHIDHWKTLDANSIKTVSLS